MGGRFSVKAKVYFAKLKQIFKKIHSLNFPVLQRNFFPLNYKSPRKDGMIDRSHPISPISSQDHFQKFSAKKVSDTQRAIFELA